MAVNAAGGKRPDLEAAAEAYFAAPSEEGLRELVEAGAGLVHHFAGWYAGGPPFEDLVQAGYEGLLKAVKRYDRRRGVRFSTFAAHCVLGEIRHQLRREASFDRPAWVAEVQARIYRAADELLQQTGAPPTLEAVARAANIRVEGVRQALRAGWVSLDELDLSRIRHLRYESFHLPIEDRIAVRQALEKLGSLQRKVIYLIFYRGLTQTQAAARLGIGQRRVSRLLARGLAYLAQYLR
ncbi:MAG: sigma-70 family RNA polymerase sigma factor [Bacillota bacterium]|nr:sigma-70 family RNA polymerase sigma factor [Bacillota bacterium]